MKQKNLVLSYGFFLVWLTGFLYNGPLLKLILDYESANNLALAYIVIPAIFCMVYSYFIKEDISANKFMVYGIAICIIGTPLLYINNEILRYILSGVLGISSVVYIAGWGKLFANNLETKSMFKIMGLTICLGKGFLGINEILMSYNMETVAKIIIMLSLIFSLYFSLKLKEEKDTNKVIKKYNRPFLYVMLTMFLVNISGGYMLSFVFHDMNNHINNFYADIAMYLLVTIVILKNKVQIKTKTTTIPVVLLAIGMLLFIALRGSYLIIPYFIIGISFLIFDIIIWSWVAMLGKVTKKPYRIFFRCMSANLFAVFVGNIIYVLTKGSDFGIIFCSIFILISFLILQHTTSELLVLESDYKRINEFKTNLDLTLFTLKENEIVILMCQNMKNKDIAYKLNISENTLKTHAKNIYQKLKVKNKKELIEIHQNKGA